MYRYFDVEAVTMMIRLKQYLKNLHQLVIIVIIITMKIIIRTVMIEITMIVIVMNVMIMITMIITIMITNMIFTYGW